MDLSERDRYECKEKTARCINLDGHNIPMKDEMPKNVLAEWIINKRRLDRPKMRWSDDRPQLGVMNKLPTWSGEQEASSTGQTGVADYVGEVKTQ